MAAKSRPKPGASRNGSGKKAAAARKAREARALRVRLVIGALLLVAAGAVVFLAARPANDTSTRDQLVAGAGGCTFDTRYDGDKSNQGDHVAKPTYAVDPPSGGPHLATAAEPGYYQPGEAPPDGQVVHAQEHGFVILWYRPDLSEAKTAQLAALSDTFGRELILVPRKSLAGDIAVTAWHKRLLCAELVPSKVELFTRTYTNQGPEKGFL